MFLSTYVQYTCKLDKSSLVSSSLWYNMIAAHAANSCSVAEVSTADRNIWKCIKAYTIVVDQHTVDRNLPYIYIINDYIP